MRLSRPRERWYERPCRFRGRSFVALVKRQFKEAVMRRIVLTEFVSLDGVMEDPGGAEGYKHGGWAFKFDDPEGGRYKLDETLGHDALLLGRVTYEGFAAAWPGITD